MTRTPLCQKRPKLLPSNLPIAPNVPSSDLRPMKCAATSQKPKRTPREPPGRAQFVETASNKRQSHLAFSMEATRRCPLSDLPRGSRPQFPFPNLAQAAGFSHVKRTALILFFPYAGPSNYAEWRISPYQAIPNLAGLRVNLTLIAIYDPASSNR